MSKHDGEKIIVNNQPTPDLKRRRLLKASAAAGLTGLAGSAAISPTIALAGNHEIDLFRIAMWSGMPNLDPEQNAIRTAIIAQNWIFDPLVFRDGSTNELKPYLADEYSFIANNTWRFKIREGVKFHNGKDLTAHSVRFSILRRINEEIGSPHRKQWGPVVDVNVVDKYTVDIVCNSPFPTITAYMPILSIFEEGYYSDNSKEFLALNPMGSGPFRLEEFKPDEVLKVVRNDDYWGQKPIIKRVEAPYIGESATRVAALLAGDISLTKCDAQDFDRIDSSGVAKMTAIPGNRIVICCFNYEMEPFNNRKVRQAINHAVNQQEINEVYIKGSGELLGGPIPSTVFGHNPDLEPYEYNPALAKQMLAEAGYPNGFKTRIEVVPQWMISGMEITQALVNYLREIGIEAEIEVRDAGTLAGRITSRKAGPMYMLSWGGNSTFDSDSYIGALLGKGAWSTSDIPEVDTLVAQSRATADSQERLGLFQKAGEVAREDAPWVFLHLQPNAYGVSLNHNWQARADEMMPLWYTKKV